MQGRAGREADGARPTPPRAYDAAPVATALPAGADGKPNESDRKDGEALLAAWLAAQNQGDFAGYQTLYGERFTGVRRSGSTVRRFDRAGWMADRRRMFAKPMVVGAEALVVTSHGAQTHLFLTQSFEQGSFKDTGRKWIALERAAGGSLRIAREEMLDSTLVAKQEKELSDGKAAPDAKPLAAGDVELGWAGKRDKLYLAPVDHDKLFIGRASGWIGTGPVTVLEHTFDSASGSLAGVSASRAVGAKKLPPALAARLGKTVQLLDGDSRAALPRAHQRLLPRGGRLGARERASGSVEEAAAALLDDAPLVVAELQMSGCPTGAAFGRDVDLPALPEVPALEVAEETAARKALAADFPDESTEVSMMRVAGKPSLLVAAASGHTADTCETQEEYRTHLYLLTRQGRVWTPAPLAEYSYEDRLYAAVDADRDGTVDVFTMRGSHRGTESDFWAPDLRVFWPPGLGCDGCEGDECGD